MSDRVPTPEGAYMRGYRDGWDQALSASRGFKKVTPDDYQAWASNPYKEAEFEQEATNDHP